MQAKIDGKPRFELIDPGAELGLAMVLTGGALKYPEGQWKGTDSSTRKPVYGALRRHYNAITRGEMIDEEFGLPHSVHLYANAMFLAAWDMEALDCAALTRRWRRRLERIAAKSAGAS